MAIEILRLAIIMVCIMIMMRFIFVEIDGRTALKRSNIAYFLSFEDKYKYKRLGNNLLLIGFALLFFTEIDFTTAEGLFYFVLFFAIAVISDFISGFAYYLYGKSRYKTQIQEAVKFLNKLKDSVNQEVNEDDAYVYGQDYQFVDVVKDYVYPSDHFVCLSTDGGELMESMQQYPQVSFLIDRKHDEAKARMENTPVRLTTLTKDHRYPFKDERMDVVVCYNENFSPDEGKRILKDGGTLLINQLGSENLLELYAFLGPRVFAGNWNLENLKKGLMNHGYRILMGHEEKAEIRFRTLAAFHDYIKDIAFVKVDDLKRYANQYYAIYSAIEKHGFYAMKTHRFYVAARKDNVV